MRQVSFDYLEKVIRGTLTSLNMPEGDINIMMKIYLESTKRGVGHHDIHNFPARIEAIRKNQVNLQPKFEKISAFGCMESWDGDNGLGEIINTFIMDRAIASAKEHGMGFCTVRNSNHYLASAPYITQSAEAGCIGIIIAKGVPTMGLPGSDKNLIGQSPIGFAFPTEELWPVMMDICLAYSSGEELRRRANNNIPVPEHWGVSREGKPTTDAAELMKGIKYPIGEHKGFGLAILCELLTGVLSQGFILDEGAEDPQLALRSTSHTAIAIKVDALMDVDTYKKRSSELLERITARSSKVRIPGLRSYETKIEMEKCGNVSISDELYDDLNKIVQELGISLQ